MSIYKGIILFVMLIVYNNMGESSVAIFAIYM